MTPLSVRAGHVACAFSDVATDQLEDLKRTPAVGRDERNRLSLQFRRPGSKAIAQIAADANIQEIADGKVIERPARRPTRDSQQVCDRCRIEPALALLDAECQDLKLFK